MAAPSRAPSDGRRVVLEVVGLAATALLVASATGVAFVVPLVVLGFDIETTPVLVATNAVGQLGLLLVAAAYLRWRGTTVVVGLPSRSELVTTVGPTAVGVAVGVALSTLRRLLVRVPEPVLEAIGATILRLALVGSVYGAVHERTGNLVVPIATHATYEVVLLAGTYLGWTGWAERAHRRQRTRLPPRTVPPDSHSSSGSTAPPSTDRLTSR